MLQRTIHRPIPASSEQEPTHLKNTFEKEKKAVDVPLSNRFRHSQPKSRETEKQEKVWVNRLLPSCNHEFRGGGKPGLWQHLPQAQSSVPTMPIKEIRNEGMVKSRQGCIQWSHVEMRHRRGAR